MAYGAAAAGAIGSGGNTSTQPPAAGSSAQPPAYQISPEGSIKGKTAQPPGNAASQGLTAAETAEIHKLALELSKFKDSNEQVYRAYLDYIKKFPQQ